MLSSSFLSIIYNGRDILVTKFIPPTSPFLLKNPVNEEAGLKDISRNIAETHPRF